MKTLKLIVVVMIVAVFAAGCPKKQSPGEKSPAAESGQGAAGQQQTGQTAQNPNNPQGGQQGQQSQTNPAGSQTYQTEPISSKDFGAISGRIILNAKPGERGNLFIYIPDANSVNDSTPKAIASQIFTADKIKGDVVEYKLDHVPAGEYSIFAIWDIAQPYCDASVPVCAIGEDVRKDRFAQSDPITIVAGTMTKGVDIRLNLTTP